MRSRSSLAPSSLAPVSCLWTVTFRVVAAPGKAYGVSSALGDSSEQSAGGDRPIDGALETDAVSGDSAREPTYRVRLAVTDGRIESNTRDFPWVGRLGVLCRGGGKAAARETISPQMATGSSAASRDESALRSAAVVVIVFIKCPRCA